MKSYAGIGSRETPMPVQAHMTALARRLCALNYMLRSGAAPGADSAFEAGAGNSKQIFLPWKKFNGHTSPLCYPSHEAIEMAARFHPNWAACSSGARALHARNCHQVLGMNLNDPVQFILCWTRGGSGSGGTGQALRIAKHHKIPIFDLGFGRQVVHNLATLIKKEI